MLHWLPRCFVDTSTICSLWYNKYKTWSGNKHAVMWLENLMENSIVLMWEMRTVRTRCVSMRNTWIYLVIPYLSMSLAKMIWPNIFSTSRTSNRRNLFSSEIDKRCDGWRSPSRTAHKTRPGGNKSAICMFASKVFRVARYCGNFSYLIPEIT